MASKGAKKVSLYILSRQPLTSEAEREEYWKFIANSSASDRSVAIRASAFVEHQLLDLLLHAMRMMDNEEIENSIFQAERYFG